MCLASSSVPNTITSILDDADDSLPLDPLAEMIDGIDQKVTDSVIIQVEESDSEDRDFLILIVLACLLIPLLAILGFIIYICRKNRQEAAEDSQIALNVKALR